MGLRRSTVLRALLCLVLAAAFTTSGVAQAQVVPKYVYVDLGPVGLTSTALDVNNAMQAVVTSGTAFRWENGTLLNLGTLCSGCNPRRSYGTAVNDTGEVAGYTHVQTTEPPHAFVYRGGAMIDLGTGFGSGSSSAAWGINSGGQVVGERTRSQSSPKRAALWQNGTIRDLGTLGGTTTQRYATESIAYAINDSGQVVGTALPSKGYPLHGFVWQNGVMRDLGTLGGDGEATEARDIADTGQIVGSSQNTGGEIHAFTWTAGTMTDLGTLGGDYSSAYGVNEHGRIVGGSRIADSPDPNNAGHAVLWTDGLMVDLNEHVTNLPEDVALEVAWSINDDGAIVGTTCSLYCEPGKTATPRGFLLVPQSATA